MDIGQFVFPFIMAVITNSIMIIIVYFLRKIPAFINLFGVWYMALLYLLCIMRIFVPIELPGVHIILQDNKVYTSVVNFFAVRDTDSSIVPRISFYILIGVWIVGSTVTALYSIVKQRHFRARVNANGDYATERERSIFSEVVKDVLKSERHITLRKTDVVNGTVFVGLVHKTILIPDDTFTDDELRMMFLHECVHIKNKDLWIKLLVHIYCSLFWWNPFAYLLKSDLDTTLEMKCDLNATKDFSDIQKLTYVETLKNRCVYDRRKRLPLVVSAEFADGKKKTKLLERVKAILANPPKKVVQVIMNSVAVLIILSVFIASYLFIWQPYFYPTEELYELKASDKIADDTNSYLVKQNDGNYLFYFDDYPPMEVSKEEVEQGMYEDYPIHEK